MTTAYLAISRLIDNYEDKGEFSEDFERLNIYLAEAMEASPSHDAFMDMCLENGVLCSSDYEEEEREEELKSAIIDDIMDNMSESDNLDTIRDALALFYASSTVEELQAEYKERAQS
jgi:hypothetical protein